MNCKYRDQGIYRWGMIVVRCSFICLIGSLDLWFPACFAGAVLSGNSFFVIENIAGFLSGFDVALSAQQYWIVAVLPHSAFPRSPLNVKFRHR